MIESGYVQMLSGWEEDNPCKYVGYDCTGKIFGALKDCRRRREKSEALCEQKEEEEKKLSEIRKRNQRLVNKSQQILEQGLTAIDEKQSSDTALKASVGVTSVLILALGAYSFYQYQQDNKGR